MLFGTSLTLDANEPEDIEVALLLPDGNVSGDDEAVVLVADVAEAKLLEPSLGIPPEDPEEDGVMPNEKGEEDIAPVATDDVVVDVDDRAVVPEPSLKPLSSPSDDAMELPPPNEN